MKLLAALLLLAAAPVSAAEFGVSVMVVHSATVSAQAGNGKLSLVSRGAQPARVEVAQPDAAGQVVVTVQY